MPPQIPSPIIAGGQSRPGVGEQLLLGLVSQAPGLIFNILEQRQRARDEQEAGQASRAILQSLTQAGTFGPELETALKALGGEITPAQSIGPTEVSVPGPSGQTGDLATPARQQTVGNLEVRPRETDLSGIDPRSAEELLSQFLGTQQAVSEIEATEAETELREVQKEGQLIDNRTSQLQLEVSEKIAPFQVERAELQNRLTEAQIERNLAEVDRIQAELDRIDQQEDREIFQAAEELVNTDYEQLRRWTQTLGSFVGVTAEQARLLATRATFGQNIIPSRQELRSQKRAVLSGEAPGPTDEQRRTQLAGQLGIDPQLQSTLDQGLAQFDDISSAFDAFKDRVRESESLSEEQKARVLFQGGLYMEGITGEDLGLRKEMTKKERSILGRLIQSITRAAERPSILPSLVGPEVPR